MCLPNAQNVFKVEREWEHAGLLCAVVQGRENQNRCGYVRVPPGHKFHGLSYMDIDVDVHGGITFAAIEPCSHEDGTGWWLGFDCAHAYDATWEPGKEPDFIKELSRKYPTAYLHEHFWTHDEVVAETERLAEQLIAGVK